MSHRESASRTLLRVFVCVAVGAFVGAILPVVAMALYGLGVGLADEGWRAPGDLLGENMLVGAMFMLMVENQWLWVGGTLGAVTGLVGACWNSMVRRTSLRTTRRLVAAGGLVAMGLILALVLSVSEERSTIDARYLEFCTAVHHKEYEVAYRYLAPAYQKSYDVEQFAEDYRSKGWCIGDCT